MNNQLQEQVNEFCSYFQQWKGAYEEHARSIGMNYTNTQILDVIYNTENCTQKLLCERCFLPKQTINTIVSSFCEQGWVYLEALPQDRRVKAIRLTPEGKAFVETSLHKVWEAECRAMAELTDEQRTLLLDLTRQYVTLCRQALFQED